MKCYLDNWGIIEGSLQIDRINKIPDCLEKEHLVQIRAMLTAENFNPDDFQVREYPTQGVYCCCRENQSDYFTISEDDGKLRPHYQTTEYDENGINDFPCDSIKSSIDLTEC